MGLGYEEAIAGATAPGQIFETVNETVDGVELRVFKNAPANLRDVFNGVRNHAGDFIVYEGERWSFERFAKTMDELAAGLVTRYGIKRGDRVAIAMRNLPEWVVAFGAILTVGGVSVSMNAWWTEDEMDYALEDSGAKLVFVDADRIDRCASPARRLGIKVIGVRIEEPVDGVDRFEEVLVPGASLPEVAVLPEDDATILYTSGTTGRPKGAVSTHRAITQALMAFMCSTVINQLRKDPENAEDQGPGYPPAFILIVPLFHVTGCVPVMLSSVTMGFRLVMMYKWEPKAALELIESERVTNFIGVPTQSWDLLEHPDFAKYDSSSLASIGGGGAPAPPKLVGRVESSFKKGRPQIGYGMTETNAYGPGNSGDDYVSHPTSTGRAFTPILDVEIRDEDLNPLPTDARGEIWMKGPNLIRGYWNKVDATAETIVDGWLRSGDLGRIDGDGFLYIEDRAKDMVLRAGENVYCAEVEAAIYEHPAVYEAAVLGIPHERLGEEVVAAVVLKAGETLSVEDLRAHVAKHLAGFKVPSQVIFAAERLPRNPSGKILKRELRDTLFAK
ncbi:MAG: AMP-binding protein [Actinomycetota bacterium]